MKLLYLALPNASKKWTRPIQNRSNALNQFAILWPERVQAPEPAARTTLGLRPRLACPVLRLAVISMRRVRNSGARKVFLHKPPDTTLRPVA